MWFKFTDIIVKSSLKLSFKVIFEVNDNFLSKILLQPLLHEQQEYFGIMLRLIDYRVP